MKKESLRILVRHKPIFIAVLLSLLALEVKGIYTGPTLPAFLTPNVVEILQARFDLCPT